MRHCVFLSFDNPRGYVIDDELTYGPLRELGWEVHAISWRRTDVDWNAYEAVIIRSTWDYTEAHDAFLAALERIARSGTQLFNALELVRWNAQKTYLRDLAARGVPIIPTVWRDYLGPGELVKLFDTVGAAEAVIKPNIGANARATWRLDQRSVREQAVEIETYYASRPLMMQPLVQAVVTEGEFSLIYFNGELSHTVLKTPKPNDFRVQEDHGGYLRKVEADGDLRAAGDVVLRALGQVPLYARVDFARANGGQGFWLMEIELIEPSLYFHQDEQAAHRFARALHERLRVTS